MGRTLNAVRKAVHSGSWYLAEEARLKKQLEGWLQEARVYEGRIPKAVIVPHAGYTYSGRTAAECYAQLRNQKISRIFVLGPSHHLYSQQCMLPSSSCASTPFGLLMYDHQVITDLENSGKFSKVALSDEEEEHSLEMQFPFLSLIFATQAKIIPIMVGHVNDQKKEEYASLLSPYLSDPSTLFCISSDFTHWGKRFGYTPFDSSIGDIWESIKHSDLEAAELITKHDAEGFAEFVDQTEISICGHNCIEIYLRALQKSGLSLKTERLYYDQSSQVTHPSDSSVSYCSICSFVA